MFPATLNSSMRLVSRTRADPSLRVYRVSKSTFVASCVFRPHIYGTEMSHAAQRFLCAEGFMSQAAIWVHQNYEGALLCDFMRAAGREAGDGD